MVVKSAAAQKEHFLSCAVSSHFLVLFVEFFLGKLPKTGFFAQCHESDIIARFVVFRLGKFRYDDTKERLAAACPALPDAEKQQGGIHLHFIDADGSFTLERTEEISQLYFPLASEDGLKSCVSPDLGGDAKLDQETFLLEPVSVENLHNNRSTRNFWLVGADGTALSLTGASAAQQAAKFTPAQEDSRLTAGFMWHTLERTLKAAGVRAVLTSFAPVGDNVEVLSVTVENITDSTLTFTPYGAVPLYGRSADNLRDHRNVTSMLHRIRTTAHGVRVCPTMSFDERGHRPNRKVYYLLGYHADGQAPTAFYPTVEEFIGEGGSFTHPRAVLENRPGVPTGACRAGREAMGTFRFAPP